MILTNVYDLDKCVQFGQACTIWTGVFNLDKCVQFGQVSNLVKVTIGTSVKLGKVYNLDKCKIWAGVQF